MALGHSPGIVTNGLVFAYDMNNPTNSWRGKPITNQFAVPAPNNSGDVTFAVNGTGTFRRIYDGIYGNYEIKPTDIVYRYNLSSTGGCHYHGNSASIGAGQYATFTFDYYISPDAANYPSTNFLANFENYGGSALGGSAAAPNSTKGIWQTVTFTSGPTAGSGTQAMFLYPGGCGGDLATSGYVLFKNPQVIFSSNANDTAPYVNGARANTQALVDQTGLNTITASSLTYNNDGSFSFNGSSNTMDCGNASAISSITGTSNVTVEAWVRYSSYSGGAQPYSVITHKGYPWAWLMENPSNTARIRFYLSNSGDVSCSDSATHALNTWYHFVGTYDGSNMRFYRNGELRNTVAGSGTLGGSGINMVVGSYSGGYFMNGSIPVLRIYNRTLDASEVLQNFNALRSRYSI